MDSKPWWDQPVLLLCVIFALLMGMSVAGHELGSKMLSWLCMAAMVVTAYGLIQALDKSLKERQRCLDEELERIRTESKPKCPKARKQSDPDDE